MVVFGSAALVMLMSIGLRAMHMAAASENLSQTVVRGFHGFSPNFMETGTMDFARRTTRLFVDRSMQKWIVQDELGDFWILPGGANPWAHRQRFEPIADTDLEPVPGHYKQVLGIPAHETHESRSTHAAKSTP